MIFVYLKYKSYTFCCFRLFTQSHIKNNLQLRIALLNVPDKVGITLLDLVEPVRYFYSLLPVACQQLVKRVVYVTIYLPGIMSLVIIYYISSGLKSSCRHICAAYSFQLLDCTEFGFG